MRSSSRPGVAISTSTPRARAETCGPNADAAEDDGVAQADVMSVGAGALADLGRQLARRRQDEGPRGARRRSGACRRQMLEDGQQEGRGLAGAGLGDAQDVLAFQQQGDGPLLDRGRREIVLGMQGTPERLGDAEVGKRNIGQVTVILMHQLADARDWRGRAGAYRSRPRAPGANEVSTIVSG